MNQTRIEIEILSFNPRQKNTLRGFFDIALVGGMIIRNLSLFEKGAARWIGLPSEKFTGKDGATGYKKIIEFQDRDSLDAFRDGVLAALDAFQKKPAANQNSGGGDEWREHGL